MPIVSRTTDDGLWKIDMEWREGDYQGGPVGMWVRPTDPAAPPQGGLSSTVLRGIDFRKARAQLQKQMESDPHGLRANQGRREAQRLDQLRDHLALGINADYLALLASEYLLRVNNSQPKPVERLADDLGKAAQTIQGHLWQARKRQLLLGSAGRKGGELSDDATKILRQIASRPPLRPPVTQTSLIDDDPPAGMEEGGTSDR